MHINYHLCSTKIHYGNNFSTALPLVLICRSADVAEDHQTLNGAIIDASISTCEPHFHVRLNCVGTSHHEQRPLFRPHRLSIQKDPNIERAKKSCSFGILAL